MFRRPRNPMRLLRFGLEAEGVAAAGGNGWSTSPNLHPPERAGSPLVVKAADLAAEAGRELRSIEAVDGADAAHTVQQPGPLRQER